LGAGFLGLVDSNFRSRIATISEHDIQEICAGKVRESKGLRSGI